MAYPTLPEEAQKELDNVAGKYSFFIHTQQYSEAQNIITDLFSKMLSWQKQYGQRFHKGYPLHNIGYALYLQNKHEEALKYFILAYIEDRLSADNEDDADSTPAGQTLLLGYKLSPELFNPLKQLVGELKKQNNIPLHPLEVLQELEKSKPDYEKDIEAKRTEPKEHRRREFTIFGRKSKWEIRVFVGGSGKQIKIFEAIRDTVEGLGYDPIVAVEFNMPKKEMEVYNKCLILLHCCKYAIFDLSEPGGQLIRNRACS